MKHLEIIGIAVWLIIGMIAVWREYWARIKYWYERFGKDLRKEWEFNSHLIFLLICSPVFICGGILTWLVFEYNISRGYSCWYFKVPKTD